MRWHSLAELVVGINEEDYYIFAEMTAYQGEWLQKCPQILTGKHLFTFGQVAKGNIVQIFFEVIMDLIVCFLIRALLDY